MNEIAAAAAKSLQSCPTLCDPIDGSPPGSPIPAILQAKTLEWVAISFSNAWKWKVKVKSLSHVRLFATPWTAAHQAPPSMWFSRQEYWSGVPLPSPFPLLDSAKQLFRVVELIDAAISSVWKFQLLQILINTCYYLSFHLRHSHWWMWSSTTLWVLFELFWWLMKSNPFLCLLATSIPFFMLY